MRLITPLLFVFAASLTIGAEVEHEIKIEPHIVHLPRVSVYRLLSGPAELDGKVVTTSGFFVFVRGTARLFPSKADALDNLPDNFVIFELSDALKSEVRVQSLLTYSEPLAVEISGRFEVRTKGIFPYAVAEVSEFVTIRSSEPNKAVDPPPRSAQGNSGGSSQD